MGQRMKIAQYFLNRISNATLDEKTIDQKDATTDVNKKTQQQQRQKVFANGLS